MRIVLPVLAALALGACGAEPKMVAADGPPPAASAAVEALVQEGDPYAPPSTVTGRPGPQAPPSTL